MSGAQKGRGGGGAGAGVVRISSNRDDRMGEKIQTQKNPKGFKKA